MPRSQPSRAFAEGAAARLWKQFCLAGPADLDLEVIAACRDVYVVEARLDSADAWLVRAGDRGIIRVSDRIAEPGRKRFAVAHELGHFELHKAVSQLSACTSRDMHAAYNGSGGEAEANWFAAELLMPGKLFAAALDGAFPSFAEVRRLAEYFGTTLTATAVRMVESADEECAFVVSEGGRVRWWRGSERFMERYWLTSGAALSAESAAGSVFAGEPTDPGPVRVAASAWGASDEDDWWEDVVVADLYGQVLSLLRPG